MSFQRRIILLQYFILIYVIYHLIYVLYVQYGREAAVVATDSMSAAGNAAMTYLNVQSLGAKGLAKKTAKNTGKTLAKNVIQAHVGEKGESSLEEKK